MEKNNQIILRHIDDIVTIPTSHNVGEKRIIATGDDVGKYVTQIARTILRKGENVNRHSHPTMDEHFFFIQGQCVVKTDKESLLCRAGDYLYIPANCPHEIEIWDETTMFTIGLAL